MITPFPVVPLDVVRSTRRLRAFRAHRLRNALGIDPIPRDIAVMQPSTGERLYPYLDRERNLMFAAACLGILAGLHFGWGVVSFISILVPITWFIGRGPAIARREIEAAGYDPADLLIREMRGEFRHYTR